MSRFQKSLKAVFAAVVITALTGCAALFDAQPVPLYVKAITGNPVLLYLDDPNHDFPNKLQTGMSWWYRRADGIRVCHIKLREYPKFLGHEVDHCYREHWHSPLIPNSDDFK